MMYFIARKIARLILPKSCFPIGMFPYPKNGEPYKVSTGMDDTGMPWVEHEGEKVYFRSSTPLLKAESAFRTFLEEEGLTGFGRRSKSPHCYVTKTHRPMPGDVLVDVGCSEGFFARHFAKTAKKLVLIEANPEWENPLRKTFSDYLSKTTIVPKIVGNGSDGQSVRLSDVLAGMDKETFFVKMDMEGAEVDVVASSADFLQSHKVKLSCCTYHRQSDARILKAMLRKLGFATEFSSGWMLTYGAKMLRRGVIYAQNFPVQMT